MTNPAHPSLGKAQTVTASALVRQFGLWQDRAGRAPVYILHRGRPRLALTSIDLLEALCAPPDSHPDGEAAPGPILDAVSEIVVIVGGDGTVAHLSAAARDHFAVEPSWCGPLDRLAPGPATGFLVDTTCRVIARGIAETIEIGSPARPGRRLSVAVRPWRRGAALFARDVTTDEELKDALGQVQALDHALAAVEDAATARLNLRGYLESPAPSLAALTGVAVEALASVRFVTLLDIGSRVAAAEMIEAVIADGVPRGLSATMPVNRADSRPIRIGFSRLRRGMATEGVAAVLIGDRSARSG